MTKISIKELESKWDSINENGYILLPGQYKLAFHIGYTGNHQKAFVVMDMGKLTDIVSSKAIMVECIQTVEGKFALRFVLNDDLLSEIFVKLCWNLVEASQNEHGEPIDNIIAQYSKWQKLLQIAKNEIMSLSQQKGLLGELLYLHNKIDEIGDLKALESWVGPEGADQDFIFDSFWAEVKAVAIGAETVGISSLQQFECASTGELFVYFLDKISNCSVGICLSGIISMIEKQVSDDYFRDVFHCKLNMYGYLFKDAKEYDKNHYKLSEQRRYIVNKEFPRLVRSNVPVEVIAAKYKLSFAAIDKYRGLEDR